MAYGCKETILLFLTDYEIVDSEHPFYICVSDYDIHINYYSSGRIEKDLPISIKFNQDNIVIKLCINYNNDKIINYDKIPLCYYKDYTDSNYIPEWISRRFTIDKFIRLEGDKIYYVNDKFCFAD